jgi:nucleotide-binding universal stress UspA family protein
VSGASNHSKAAHFLADIIRHKRSNTTITVLHVMSQVSARLDGQQAWQLEASAEELIAAETPEGQLLSKETAILRKTSAHIQPKVRHGVVVDEVLTEALDGDYDLLVIGAHRQAGWQRYLLDDLSHQIITRADRMVLVV